MPHTPADISQLIVDAVGLQDALFDANLTEARRRARRIHRVSTRLGYPVLIEASRNALCHLAETIRLTASIRTSVEALFFVIDQVGAGQSPVPAQSRRPLWHDEDR